MTDLAELGFVVRTGELAKAEQSLDRLAPAGARAERAQAGVGRASERMGQQIDRSLAPLRYMQGLLATIAAGAAVHFISSQLEGAQAIGQMADITNLGTRSLQEYQYALTNLAKLTKGEVDDSLRRFNRRLGLAREAAGPAKAAFDEMFGGVEQFGNTESALEAVIAKLAEIEDGATRAGLASLYFGDDAGPKMAAAIGKGTVAIEALRREAHSLGLVLEQDLIDNADRIKTEFDKVSQVLDTAMMRALGELMPLLSNAADASLTLAQNLDVVAKAAGALAVVIGGRLVAAMAAKQVENVKATAAALTQAKADAVAAQQLTRRTGAELSAARAIQARALADAKALAGTNAHAFAVDHLTASTVRLTAAQRAHTAATAAASTAMARASVTARSLSAALAFFGGPIGLTITAVAAGIYILATRQDTLKKATDEVKAAHEELNKVLGDDAASKEALSQSRQRTEAALKEAEAQLAVMRAEQEAAQARLARQSRRSQQAAAGLGLAGSVTGDHRQSKVIEQIQAQVDALRASLEVADEKLKTMGEDAGGAGGGGISKGLLDQYAQLEARLKQQVALYGETSEAAKLRYEFEHGALQGLNAEQQARLEGLAAELDALDAAATQQKKQALEAQRAAESEQEGLRAQARLVKESLIRPQERYNAQLEVLDALLEKSLITWEQYSRAVAGATNELDSFGRTGNRALKDLELAVHGFGRTFEDAMVTAARSGTLSFRTMTEAILEDLYRIILRAQIIRPALAGLGSAFPSLNLTANADGNVIRSGNVIPFARGGVVDGPTLFPMAGSRTGLMGEAGPEAIMPLSRGKDGKLGVKMEGGGAIKVEINQSIDARGQGDQAAQNIRNSSREMANMIIDTVVADIGRRGAIAKAMGN